LQKEEEMNKRLVVPVFFFLIQIPLLPAWADVTMPAMFSDHAVLQRDMMIPVWGTASPGEGVTVNFAGHEISTAASGSGDWMVLLDPMPANASPETMTITGNNVITIDDLLVGEVWLGSGQSNMQRPLSDDCDAAAAIGDAVNYPNMRFFNVTASGNDVNNTVWEVSDAISAPSMSAVHYYFGRHLMQEQPDVPVGLIASAVGATAIERWATCAGSGSLYTGQISPLQPYGIKGATWYQGEWDSRSANDAEKYYWQLPCLIDEWRSDWGQPSFPFYVVQMPKMGLKSIHIVRDAELQAALSDPQVEMIVTIDQPGHDVHPPCKDPFGRRLARLALKLEYDVDLAARSPLPNAAASYVGGGSINVVFDHVADGLESGDEAPLAEWEVAGADGNWMAADAEILGSDTVVVSSPLVSDPVSARYAYSTNPAANNLVSSAGLPASPIREVTPDPGAGFCGDLACGAGEDRCTCAVDCGEPPESELDCSDGLDDDCDSEFDCDDPDCLGDPACAFCGDGACNPGEDECGCSLDCGMPPASETVCFDGLDEDCDGSTDCDDSDCAEYPACQSACGDDVCGESEDCNSCPEDCESRTTGKPTNRYCCGNGILEGPEGDGRCDGNP
jgi:sialate O-acetylesterase